MHHPTDRKTHTTAFVTPVVEHWLEREMQLLEVENNIKRLTATWITTVVHWVDHGSPVLRTGNSKDRHQEAGKRKKRIHHGYQKLTSVRRLRSVGDLPRCTACWSEHVRFYTEYVCNENKFSRRDRLNANTVHKMTHARACCSCRYANFRTL